MYLPPIIADCHHITAKLLSMAKNSNQSINKHQMAATYICMLYVTRPRHSFTCKAVVLILQQLLNIFTIDVI
jgi:hypothetical protein